jgi:WD40 repeat protein
MSTQLRCERCGAELAGQALGGQCGNCLLQLALDQTDPGEQPTVGIPTLPAEFARVRYFGDYELLEEIARGGMGVVYRAKQVSLNRIVALKMILSGQFSSARMVQRFQTEAEAAARLDHPNIVPIYEIGRHQAQHYFSMRFLEGGTLTQAMALQKFEPRRAAELMVVVARAVHYAHQHGIVHRDMKPGNILLDLKGEPHVADFGLAKLLESDTELTHTQAVLGTPSYMAPEQASGASKQATTAIDIYSLGSILYELLTGRPPFKAETAINTLHLVLEAEPAKPHLLNPELDRDIETICLKCLEKDPRNRYASADALAEDLQRWLSDHPILARPVMLPERAFKWARRRPAIASLIVAIHLVALAGLVGILRQSRRANHQATIATSEAQRANDEASRAEHELWNARFSEARAIRIAGGSGARLRSRALVEKLVERPDLTDAQRLGLREEAIAQLALVDIELSTNWISKTNWLPMHWNKDLTRYLQCFDAERIELLEYPSHRLIRSFPLPERAILDQVLMSPNEEFLAARYRNGGLVNVWGVRDGELIYDGVHKGPNYWRVSFSGDSRTMMIVGEGGVTLQGMATKQASRILNGDRRVVQAALSPDSSLIAAVLPNRTGEIWHADSGELLGLFHIDFIADRMVWHSDGVRLVVCGDRGRLEVRTVSKLPEGKLLVSGPRPLSGHTSHIDALVPAPEGSSFLTHAWDNYTISWDLVSGRPQLRDSRISVSQVHSSGEEIVTIRESPLAESVAKFHRSTGYKTLSSLGRAGEPLGICFSPDGRLGAVSYFGIDARAEGECLVWDTARNTEVGRVNGFSVQFSRDGDTLFAIERAGNRVVSYDVSVPALATNLSFWERGEIIYEGLPGESVNTGQMAPDGRTLVVVSAQVIIFIDTLGEQPVRRWNRSAHAVELSSDGKWLASMLHSHSPILWDLSSGRARYTGSVNSQIRLGGDQWFSVAEHNRVQIHNLDPLQSPQEPILVRGGGSPPALAFSPDGQIFAMGLEWTAVRLYETATCKYLATLTPPSSTARIGKLAFSADGRWLAAAMDDGVSIGWDLPVIRKELATLGLDWTTPPIKEDEPTRKIKAKLDLSGLFSSGVRDPSTPKELLDLSAYYTSTLDENWHPGNGSSDLANLPHGLQTLGGVRFDLRGLIQVGSGTRGGLPYPRETRGIIVDLSCERLHFVHSAVMAFDIKEGTEIGSYLVHYQDKKTVEIPIVFGRDVADWFSQKNENLPALTLAWSGENEASRSAGRTIRLFKSTWENPRPTIPITHFDFMATHHRAAPFLVAVTAE